jgi:ribosomal protein S6
MITAGDFRNGITIEMDNGIYQIIEFQHVKPGKGAAFVRTKLKNIVNGGVIEKTDRWGARKLQYPINYKSEGYYVLTTFEAEKSLVVEIKRIVGITDGIIRRLITKI